MAKSWQSGINPVEKLVSWSTRFGARKVSMILISFTLGCSLSEGVFALDQGIVIRLKGELTAFAESDCGDDRRIGKIKDLVSQLSLDPATNEARELRNALQGYQRALLDLMKKQFLPSGLRDSESQCAENVGESIRSLGALLKNYPTAEQLQSTPEPEAGQ